MSRSKILHSYGDAIITSEKLQNCCFSSGLIHFELAAMPAFAHGLGLCGLVPKAVPFYSLCNSSKGYKTEHCFEFSKYPGL